MNLKKLPSAKSIIGTSQRIEARSTFTSETWNFNPEMGFLYLIKENYAETINESCKEHSGEVMYALAAPIEIPLSAADIAAYRALITYGPTTIVETDGAGIKPVSYTHLAGAVWQIHAGDDDRGTALKYSGCRTNNKRGDTSNSKWRD